VPYSISNQQRNSLRRQLSRLYTRFLNGITGNRINYYNGLHIHLRYKSCAGIPTCSASASRPGCCAVCLDLGFTCKQVRIARAIFIFGECDYAEKLLSVMHTVGDILLRRLSRRVYGRESYCLLAQMP